MFKGVKGNVGKSPEVDREHEVVMLEEGDPNSRLKGVVLFD